MDESFSLLSLVVPPTAQSCHCPRAFHVLNFRRGDLVVSCVSSDLLSSREWSCEAVCVVRSHILQRFMWYSSSRFPTQYRIGNNSKRSCVQVLSLKISWNRPMLSISFGSQNSFNHDDQRTRSERGHLSLYLLKYEENRRWTNVKISLRG